MIYISLASPKHPAPIRDRAPYLGLVTGAAVYWGNVAVLAHAAIAAVALSLPSAELLLALVIGLAGAVKPIFLTYLVLPLFARRPLPNRVMNVGAGLIVGLGLLLVFSLTGGAVFQAWRGLVSHFVRALLAFYLACSAGAGVNEAVAAALQHAGAPWLAAGGAGAAIGALLNYGLSRRLAWRTAIGR